MSTLSALQQLVAHIMLLQSGPLIGVFMKLALLGGG